MARMLVHREHMTQLQKDSFVVREDRVLLSSGNIAVQYCGDLKKPLLICLHGWLDNSASFYALAKELSDKYSLLLIDLPGHGLSEPLPEGADYYIWQNVEVLHELLQVLNLHNVNLVGHSMGGIIASLYAGTFVDNVQRLIMLDSLGPMSSAAKETPAQLAKAIEDKQKDSSGLRVYSSEDDALEARKKSSPGMSAKALYPIVSRNLKEVAGGFSWRTDKRLRYSSKVRLTEEQVQAFFTAITAPVLVVLAEKGIIPQTWQDQRLPSLKTHQLVKLPGHHHFHCETDTVIGIAEVIEALLEGVSADD